MIDALEKGVKKRISLSTATLEQKKNAKKPLTKKEGVEAVGRKGNTGYFDVAETDEHVPKLDGRAGSIIFDKIRRSDAQVESILNALKLPILQANYRIQPGSEDPQDILIAEQLSFNLFEDLSDSWQEVLGHILLQFDFGFSVLEKVYKFDNRPGSKTEGLFVFKNLSVRLPTSIEFWKYEKKTRSLTGIEQFDSDGERIFIPTKKILIFTHKKEGDNWEGRSVLRPIYRNWLIKDKLIKIDAIKHDRLGVGIPIMNAPEGVDETSERWGNAKASVKQIHANEIGGLVLGFGWKFEIAQGAGKGTDVVPSLKYHEQEMTKSILAQFINLGSTDSGSRALGGSFIDFFVKALQAHVDNFLDVINRFAIQEWVRFNYEGIENFPKLVADKIKDIDPQTLSEFVESGIITVDDSLEAQVRANNNLPEKEEPDEENPPPPESVDEPEPDDEDIPEGDEDDVPDGDELDKNGKPIAASVKKHKHKHKKHFARKALPVQDIPPLIIDEDSLAPEEKLVSFQAIDGQLNEAQGSLEDKIFAIRELQIEDLIVQLVAGRKTSNLRVIAVKDMASDSTKTYNNMRKNGRDQVLDEFERQTTGVGLAEIPPVKALPALFEENIELAVVGAADKLKSILANERIKGINLGLSGNELDNFLTAAGKNISKQTWVRIAALATNKGWGDGRREQSEKLKDKILYGFYSSILDANRCEVCEATQNEQSALGGRHELNDPRFITPNPLCLGDPQCRCFTIFVFDTGS